MKKGGLVDTYEGYLCKRGKNPIDDLVREILEKMDRRGEEATDPNLSAEKKWDKPSEARRPLCRL